LGGEPERCVDEDEDFGQPVDETECNGVEGRAEEDDGLGDEEIERSAESVAGEFADRGEVIWVSDFEGGIAGLQAEEDELTLEDVGWAALFETEREEGKEGRYDR
jgi:hypothetical protein